MTSPETDRRPVAIAWAMALIVVALVVGILGLTWMNRSSDPGPGAGPTTGATSAPAEDTGALAEETAAESPATPSSEPAQTTEDEDTATEPAGAGPTLSPEQEEYLLSFQRRDPEDVAALGAVDAPVVIIEFADHRCPFCARWAREVRPQLQPLIDDGTVRLEYRDVILFGEESEDTALAARAAGVQGRYWEFHDAVAAAAPESGHPDLPRERLAELAEAAGVADLDRFRADLDDPGLRAALTADREEAARLGVTSTPSFLVNTTAVVGAQPFEVFLELIDQEATRAGS